MNINSAGQTLKEEAEGYQAFEEAFQNLDTRQQKAHLQMILKAVHVYKDFKIELEFRGGSS